MGPDGKGTTWINELDSQLIITKLDFEKGTFEGTYNSAVGDAKKEYLAVGRFDNTQVGATGWTVSWQNENKKDVHSLTTWSGQLQWDKQISDYTILTTWVLTNKTKPGDDWQSTLVGTDNFTKKKPAPEITERAKLRCQRSHPKDA